MGYAYQYETSPRKLKPEYDAPKKKKKTTTKAKNVNNKTKKTNAKIKKESERKKAKEVVVARVNFTVLIAIALGCILLTMYRSVKINESFTEVQALSRTVSSLEKENSQIAVNIQNNLNLSNIESTASSVLGMQKLSSKQTYYINLDTKDYVEVTTKKAVKEEKPGFFKSLINKIINFF